MKRRTISPMRDSETGSWREVARQFTGQKTGLGQGTLARGKRRLARQEMGGSAEKKR